MGPADCSASFEVKRSHLTAVRVLISGIGSIGRRHLANLRHLGVEELLVHQAPGRSVPQVSEAIAVYLDLEEALDRKPEAVFVTNPTSLHIPTALAAARRGSHLFIEKPLSHEMAGVDELVSVVESSRLIAMVGCNFRFHPLLRLARDLLAEQSIGRVIAARLHWGEYLPGWHPWEDYRKGYSARRELGGGVILTLIHELDSAYWLFGDVGDVYAVAGHRSRLEVDVEDTAEILLWTLGGVTVSVHLNYVQRPPYRTLQVVGEDGTLEWDYYRGRLSMYSSAKGWRYWSDPPGFERNTMYVDEARHFLECLEGRAQLLAPLREGRRVLEIALAARRSAEAGARLGLSPEA